METMQMFWNLRSLLPHPVEKTTGRLKLEHSMETIGIAMKGAMRNGRRDFLTHLSPLRPC